MRQIIVGGISIVALLLFVVPVVLHDASYGVVEVEKSVSLLFVGDIMLDRDVARHAREVGGETLFAKVRSVFLEHDVVIGNLEGTVTDNISLAEASSTILRFTFAPQFAEVLQNAGFDALSLANNHSLDFGESGFEDTQSHLSQAGVAAFGSPYNAAHLATATTIEEKKVCLVGYHELFRRDPSTVVAKIEEVEPECDYTVLFAHWGEEYEHTPTINQRELAHLFVDAGADLVVGSHPHIVQPLEIYKNTAIFYSLGNFIFDQDWQPEVKRGVMVSVELDDRTQRFTLIPVNTYLEASPAEAAVTQAVLIDLGVDSPTFILRH